MSIVITLLRERSGQPLTDAGAFLAGPWDTSKEYPLASETAPLLTVARSDPSKVNITWDPDSGLAPRSDITIRVVAESPDPVSYMQVNWGDGDIDTIHLQGRKSISRDVDHTFLLASLGFGVSLYDASDVLIESDSLVYSPTLSSDWRIHQYRVERFKGTVEYQEHGRRWLPDWTPFTDAPAETNYNDADAHVSWNWGYRLWAREVDDQGRPGLIMVPSAWQETGSGEGS